MYAVLAATARRRRAAAEARFAAAQLSVLTATMRQQELASSHAALVASVERWRPLLVLLPVLAGVGVASRSLVVTSGVVLLLAAVSYPLSRLLLRNAQLTEERAALLRYTFAREQGMLGKA